MKKPETYEKLLELVNPKDLLEILDFSGINDNHDKNHSQLKRKYAIKISKSIYREKSWTEGSYLYDQDPINQSMKLDNDFYETIVKCIQDFYWWSRDFHHIYAHIYKRVVNALEIPMNEIKKIYEIKEEY